MKKTGKRRKTILIITCIIFFLVLILIVYYRINENSSSSSGRQQLPPSVKVTTVRKGDISNVLNFSGDVLAEKQVNIYSRVNGNVERIYADIGDYVHKGKLLAVIDKSTYLQTVKQTEGILNQYKATVENNKINYERVKQLYEKGLASENDLNNSETALKVSISQSEAAEANYENALIQLSYCKITAPFGGYITKRFLDAGSLVSTGTQTQNTIFTLADITKLKIMISIPEKDIPLLSNVKDAQIKNDAYPEENFTGIFKKTSQSVDPTTRTMLAEISIDNRERMLKPGMFVKVFLPLEERKDVNLLPDKCILKDDKGSFVFVIKDDLTAVKKYITTGIESENTVEITGGLEGDEKIISTGQELIRENSKVKITD